MDGAESDGVTSMSGEPVESEQQQVSRILAKQIRLYTGGRSGSVPQDVAYDLLESICCVLGVGGREALGRRTCPSGLSASDLACEFAAGTAGLAQRARETQGIWRDVCTEMPPLRNIALRDTLAGIEGFWNRYDARLFAQRIPCDIDYPLCLPVSDTLVGVDYVEEYLRRLRIEGRFLALFDAKREECILARSCPDWRGLVVNLYEPVAATAVGAALAGASIERLALDGHAKSRIRARLSTAGRSGVSALLGSAAREVGACMDMEGAEIDYLIRFAMNLQPRLSAGGIDGVFSGLE